MSAFWHQLDPESAGKAGRVEGVGPPAGAVEERAADRLRGAPVDVVDKGITRLQPMPNHPAADDRLGERHRVLPLSITLGTAFGR